MLKPQVKKTFIELVAAGEFQTEAYTKACIASGVKPKVGLPARQTAYRWAKLLATEIEHERQAVNRRIEIARQTEMVRNVTSQILSVAEVDAKLSAIILGKVNIIRHPETQKVLMVDNTTTEKLRAIDIYYKRHGHYPAAIQVNQSFEMPTPIIEVVAKEIT